MLIDAHFHLWQPDRGDYGWLTPDLPICRDYALPDYRPLLGDITGAVLVQAAPTEAETRFLLDIARGSAGLVRGVVGWVDLETPGAGARLAADPLVVGIRPMLQDIAATEWVLRPAVLANLALAHEAGLRLDALVQPRHLPMLRVLAGKLGHMPVVIDHGAKPAIAAGQFNDWADGIATLARETGWYCKLSGLATEAGPGWTTSMLRPYVAHLLACFGADRLIWGSDWPVATMVTTYRRWFETAWSLVPADDRTDVFGASAVRFYGLGPPPLVESGGIEPPTS